MSKIKALVIDKLNEIDYSIEDFIKVDDTPCPDCMEPALLRNESEAFCESCGQEYIINGKSLRFKS
tara:strand:+ start:4997 stop:5194 length:198 start_codon:yes stop_codon:yes gene_type:complete